MNITSTQRFPQALKRLNRFKPNLLLSLLSAGLVLAGHTQTYAAVTSPALNLNTQGSLTQQANPTQVESVASLASIVSLPPQISTLDEENSNDEELERENVRKKYFEIFQERYPNEKDADLHTFILLALNLPYAAACLFLIFRISESQKIFTFIASNAIQAGLTYVFASHSYYLTLIYPPASLVLILTACFVVLFSSLQVIASALKAIDFLFD